MSATDLLEALPDLIVLLHSDGTLVRCHGGRGVAALKPAANGIGKPVELSWPESVASLAKQLARDVFASRTAAESAFEHGGHRYEMRISIHGANTVLCMIRTVLRDPTQEAPEPSRGRPDRRGIMRRFRELLSVAALRKAPATVAVIQVDGVIDIEQLISVDISERIMRSALFRLLPLCEPERGGPWRYLGQLGDNQLLLVLATADRAAIESCITQARDNLRQPVSLGDAVFQLTPYCGVAILGRDASSPKALLRHASAAAIEARRTRCATPRFYGDASELTATAPLDIAHDLKDAIANGDVRLRYLPRHDLASGRLVAWAGYLRWRHPVYGEVQPVEVLRLAEVTGLSGALSLAALRCVREDFPALTRNTDARVRVSFGPPRQHLLHAGFVRDIERFLAEGTVPAERLELRISVKASLARSPADFDSLAQRGVQLVVDEIGRGMDFPLDWLGRAPMRALLLNRSWVQAAMTDAGALKMCRASAALAKALGWTPIAVGVDGAVQRDTLLELGCEQGSGELYGQSLRAEFRADIMDDAPAVAAA
jgi:EAL domain-containing protein (putative c-di-GMP-specific phosphodiesterase class I)/GGDEF domain-containing protein